MFCKRQLSRRTEFSYCSICPIEIKTPAEPKKSGKAIGKIEFQNVWFAYKKEDWVLKDVSFTVNAGESIALVGATGSGKTTVTNLLMRFYDVQKGKILLDGVDVRDWDLQNLRENFAVVLQDVFSVQRLDCR